MEDSIFTKIIKGEVPSHKVYEDEHTLAFLDIHPLRPGMVLVISKKQVEDFLQLETEDLHRLMDTAQKVARRLKEAFPDKRRIALLLEGLDVPHVHVKLLPISSGDDLRAAPPSSEPDHAALAAMAQKLAFK